jgi:cytochrome P450
MTRTAASVEGGSPEVAGPSAGLVPKGRPEPLQESALRRRWQLARWILDPTGYLRDQVRHGKQSFQVSVFGNAMGSGSIFLLTEPKSIQALMSRDTGSEFSSPGELNLILAPLLGVRNTILLSGAAHRHRRQLVMPRFHGEHLQNYARVIERITRQEMASWPQEGVISVREAMQRISMGVILEVVFGLGQTERHGELESLLTRRLGMTATPLTSAVLFFPWLQKDFGPLSPGHRIGQLARQTDELLYAMIAERRAQPLGDRFDVLSILLAARDEAGEPLSDEDVHDELITLLVAGHETTATALTSALYWLHRTPHALERLRSELDDAGVGADPIKLPYLTAVGQEALRLHPVAMLSFARQVETPVEIAGQCYEPGDLLMACIYLLHQRPDLYPEPQSFRPERFLERQFSPYEYMPFGAGVRRCVGAALAQMELKIVLATILGEMDFASANARAVPQARRGVTLGHGAPVRLRRLPRQRATVPAPAP